MMMLSLEACGEPDKGTQSAPCSPFVGERSSIVFQKPGFPSFSDEVWNTAITELKTCVDSVDVCVVIYNFDNFQLMTIKAETLEEESLNKIKSGGNQQVFFAAVQIRDVPYEGCFLARNGFSRAAPWFNEGWVMKEKGAKLLAHFDMRQMGRVGDFMHAASPKEITRTLSNAYLQLFRQN